MSPEQVRGQPADHRSDIFAFGAVLYEMLTGRRAFRGDPPVETMTAILRDEPPPTSPDAGAAARARAHRPPLPREERRASASSRLATSAFALEAVSARQCARADTAGLAAAPGVAADGGDRRRGRRRAAGRGLGLSRFTAPSAVVSFEPRTFDRRPITNARFTPDGKSIVYSAPVEGSTPELFVIYPDAEAPQPLGVTDAHLLSVSSKGELAIITEARHLNQRLFSGTLSRMTVGSSPRAVLEDVREADWSPDGAELAVVHDLGNGRDRLEYPGWTVLYEASGY